MILGRAYILLTPITLLLATVLLGSSILFQRQMGLPTGFHELFEISFYHFVPAFLWLALLPGVAHLVRKFPIFDEEWKSNLRNHVLIALIAAPPIRFLAITLDFAIKHWLGMIESPVFKIVYEVRWTILASVPKAIFSYFLIASVITYLWYSHQKKGSKMQLKTLTGTTWIEYDQILWVKAAGNYILVQTLRKQFKLRVTLAKFKSQLSEDFVQIHRSFVINKNAVTKIQHWRNGEYLLQMQDGTHLSSSRSYKDSISRVKTQSTNKIVPR